MKFLKVLVFLWVILVMPGEYFLSLNFFLTCLPGAKVFNHGLWSWWTAEGTSVIDSGLSAWITYWGSSKEEEPDRMGHRMGKFRCKQEKIPVKGTLHHGMDKTEYFKKWECSRKG